VKVSIAGVRKHILNSGAIQPSRSDLYPSVNEMCISNQIAIRSICVNRP